MPNFDFYVCAFWHNVKNKGITSRRMRRCNKFVRYIVVVAFVATSVRSLVTVFEIYCLTHKVSTATYLVYVSLQGIAIYPDYLSFCSRLCVIAIPGFVTDVGLHPLFTWHTKQLVPWGKKLKELEICDSVVDSQSVKDPTEITEAK